MSQSPPCLEEKMGYQWLGITSTGLVGPPGALFKSGEWDLASRIDPACLLHLYCQLLRAQGVLSPSPSISLESVAPWRGPALPPLPVRGTGEPDRRAAAPKPLGVLQAWSPSTVRQSGGRDRLAAAPRSLRSLNSPCLHFSTISGRCCRGPVVMHDTGFGPG